MAFRLSTIGSSGADYATWALWEASIGADGTGGETGRAILDEALTGPVTVNASNANGQDIILEAAADVRFSALNSSNGARMLSGGAATTLGIATNNVIVQDLSINNTQNSRDTLTVTGGAANANTAIVRRNMIYSSGTSSNAIQVANANSGFTMAFNLIVCAGGGTWAVLNRGGLALCNTILVVDGASRSTGLHTIDAGSVVTGNWVLGTFSSQEYTSAWAAGSTENGGEDASPPPGTFYRLGDDTRDLNDIIAVTDGVDNSRDKGSAAWDAYTADLSSILTAATGLADILGNAIDTADGRVGCEQVIVAVAAATGRRPRFSFRLGF